jgi:hypothetical protein
MCLKLLMLGEITEIVNGSIRPVNGAALLARAQCQAPTTVSVGNRAVD